MRLILLWAERTIASGIAIFRHLTARNEDQVFGVVYIRDEHSAKRRTYYRHPATKLLNVPVIIGAVAELGSDKFDFTRLLMKKDVIPLLYVLAGLVSVCHLLDY